MDDIFATKPKAATPHVPVPKAKPAPPPAPIVVEAQKPVTPVVQPQPVAATPAARGRPTVHLGGSQKCTVVLLNDQIHWLKRLEHAIYEDSFTTISRAEIIRAMIDAVRESGTDLSTLKSEVDIKEHLLNMLTKTK